MNTKKIASRFLTAITILHSSFFISCDDEISDVGTDALIGSQLTTEIESEFDLTFSQISIDKPRTNNLDYYLLGDNNQGFGNTKYSILSQINSFSTLVQDSYSEGTDSDEQEADGTDKVISTSETTYELTDLTLVIPFRYNLLDSEDAEDDGDSTTSQYNVESNIANAGILKFNVYESDYILQSTNPNDLNNNAQRYYGNGSDGVIEFGDAIKKPDLLITSFEYNLSQIASPFTVNLLLDENDIGEDDTENEDGDEHSSEGLSDQFEAIRIPLFDDETFKNKLLNLIRNDEDENEDGLNDIDLSVVTDSDFTSLFKGIYIETTDETGGVVEILDSNQSFVNAGFQLKFTRKTVFTNLEDNDESETTIDENVITTLQFSNSPINILNHTEDDPTTAKEDEVILQSGLGQLGTLDLFSKNGLLTEQQLATWRESNILLNDAVLEFTVNTTSDFYNGDEDTLPDTLFITDLETGSVLSDYATNFSSSDDNDNNDLKEGHLLSIRELDDEDDDEDDDSGEIKDIIKNDNGEIVYRINITEHLANILGQDSNEDAIELNTTLAISVTDDLDLTSASSLFNTTEEQFINQGSLLCFRTVPLYGTTHEDENKRPRLIIKYTETN